MQSTRVRLRHVISRVPDFMTPVPLDARLSVSGQIEAADLPALAGRGVTLVINNRPDGELPAHLASAQAAALAADLGVDYRYQPVTFAALSRADVDAFTNAVAQAPGCVHAHCRSGIRSASLWALGRILAGEDREAVRQDALTHGFDIKEALAWLDRQ